MATNKRTYPNSYFAWYNDDNRVAILTQDTTSTSGERTQEKYDTYQGDDVIEIEKVEIKDTNNRYVMIPKLADPHKILRGDTDDTASSWSDTDAGDDSLT